MNIIEPTHPADCPLGCGYSGIRATLAHRYLSSVSSVLLSLVVSVAFCGQSAAQTDTHLQRCHVEIDLDGPDVCRVETDRNGDGEWDELTVFVRDESHQSLDVLVITPPATQRRETTTATEP